MQQLFEQIAEAQHGNSYAMELLLEQFSPLLKRAARKLECDDAFSDLQLFLFSLLKNIDLSNMQSTCDNALATYFKSAVYHQVIYIGKKHAKDNVCENYEDLCDFEKNRCEMRSSSSETYDALLMEDLKKVLNEREQSVIYQLYFQLLTVTETASRLHITRQAVNSIKLSALRKLRNAYDINGNCF